MTTTANETPDRILSREQAAERLGVSIKTLDRLTGLPLVRLSPRRVGIRAADLTRWIEERTKVRKDAA